MRIERTGDGDESQFALVLTPGAAKVRRCGAANLPASLYDGGDGAGRRQAITEFSGRSRLRMLWRLASVDWNAEVTDPLGMVTLTYPARFPLDGRVVHDHLHRFYRRWGRHFGAYPRGAWALEFQRRGAPHFHLYVGLPAEPEAVAEWARAAWSGAVGSHDRLHRLFGVDVTACRFGGARDNASRIAEYFYKHNAKGRNHYQKEVPDRFRNVGRFWGLWGVQPREHGVALTKPEFVEIRRLLRNVYHARRRRPAPTTRSMDGVWSLTACPEDTVLRYLAWLRTPEGRPEKNVEHWRFSWTYSHGHPSS
jgi:hypothetical protein